MLTGFVVSLSSRWYMLWNHKTTKPQDWHAICNKTCLPTCPYCLTHSVCWWERSEPIDRTPETPGSDKNYYAKRIVKYSIKTSCVFSQKSLWLDPQPPTLLVKVLKKHCCMLRSGLREARVFPMQCWKKNWNLNRVLLD